jgi:hypothetical protein
MSKSATIYPTAKRRKFYRSPPRTARLLNFFHFYRCLSLSARLPHRAALASLSARRSPIGHASGTEMRSQIERMAAAGHIPAPTASPAAPCPNTATSFFLLSRLYAGSAHPLAACPAPRRRRRPTSSSIHVVHARATSSSSSARLHAGANPCLVGPPCRRRPRLALRVCPPRRRRPWLLIRTPLLPVLHRNRRPTRSRVSTSPRRRLSCAPSPAD